jgi:hypothetical protein
MYASTKRPVGSSCDKSLKENFPPTRAYFYDSNHLQIMTNRFKKISPRVTYIFLTYLDQQSVRSIDGITKKIYTLYVFLLKAKIDLTIKKMVVVGGIFS